jgi:hypothetical protein
VTERDRAEFGAIMATCNAIYGWQSFDVILEVFWRLLAPYPIAEVKAAFDSYIKKNARAPKPSDIITAINGGTAEDHATLAWPKVLALLDHYMVNVKTLIPDGAAALAARDIFNLLKADEYKYHFQAFKLYYEKYYDAGFKNKPTVFEGKREYDSVEKKYFKQQSVVYPEQWTLEDVKKHGQALADFAPNCGLLKLAAGGEKRQAITFEKDIDHE